MPNPELRETKPELADVVEQLEARYGRAFDLGEMADQATCAEGMQELGRHIARNSSQATISIGVGAKGITQVTITANPK